MRTLRRLLRAPPVLAAIAAMAAMAAMAALTLAPRPAPALDEAACHADHEAYLDALAHNREQRLAAAEASLTEATGDAHRARIRQEGEAAWEHEEQMRGLAAQNLRDCLRHVERAGAGSG